MNERGNGALLMQMGLGVVGAVHTTRSPVDFADTTPIARLTEDAEAVVVPADSPYRSLDELDDGLAGRSARRVAVAGGSSPGGPDHLAAHLLAQAVGLDPRLVELRRVRRGRRPARRAAGGPGRVRRVQPDGVPRPDRGRAAAGAGGDLRAAGAGRGRPTLREAGVDLQFANWRGLVAPPGLAEADRRALTRLVDGMHGSPEWAQVLARMNVTDAYLTGDAFGEFLRSEDERVAGVLQRLGLAA